MGHRQIALEMPAEVGIGKKWPRLAHLLWHIVENDRFKV